MNVMLLTPLFPPDTGGAAVAFHLLYRVLSGDPEISRVILLSEKNSGFPTIERLKGGGLLLRLLPRLGKVDHYQRISRYRKAWRVAIRSCALFLLVPVLSRWHRIDIIQYHCTFTHLQGKRRNRLFEWALRLSRGKKICELKDRRGIPLTAGVADCFLANSKRIFRETLERDFLKAARVEYLPVALDPDSFQISTSAENEILSGRLPEPFFCFAGDLTEGKGILPLLEAHRELLSSPHYPLSLVLMGRDKMGGRILPYLNHRTVCLGMLPHDQVLHVIRRCRFLILPSLSEGLPRVCLEALSLGKPIVYPPGIDEFEEHMPDYLLPEITTGAIRKMILKMLDGHHDQNYPVRNHDARKIYADLRTLYRGLQSPEIPSGESRSSR